MGVHPSPVFAINRVEKNWDSFHRYTSWGSTTVWLTWIQAIRNSGSMWIILFHMLADASANWFWNIFNLILTLLNQQCWCSAPECLWSCGSCVFQDIPSNHPFGIPQSCGRTKRLIQARAQLQKGENYGERLVSPARKSSNLISLLLLQHISHLPQRSALSSFNSALSVSSYRQVKEKWRRRTPSKKPCCLAPSMLPSLPLTCTVTLHWRWGFTCTSTISTRQVFWSPSSSTTFSAGGLGTTLRSKRSTLGFSPS